MPDRIPEVTPGERADAAHVDRDVAFERLDLGNGAWVDVARGWLLRPDEVFDALHDGVAWQT
ncbi:MAG: hypothetical protein ACXVLK_20410, partial [Acidimicrobiales bacterium]